MSADERPRALVLYHFFHPDDVVSAQHYADLGRGLRARGWDVTVLPSNRSRHDASIRYPGREEWEGVHIHRIPRPPLHQASPVGRILNAAWMIGAWSLALLRYRPQVLIVGTDPIFGVLTVLPWRVLRPRTRIFHWCFDLHPEAAIAEGMVSERNPAVRLLQPLLRRAYRACDLLGDLGPCMARRLRTYAPEGRMGTYTPWALSEPAAPLPGDPAERHALFGDATLTLLYSGNFGRAHDADLILALARRLRAHPRIRFAFGVRGDREAALRQAVGPEDHNVTFLGFAPRERLEARLGAADIHMVSLRPEFTGTVVPSKFQGALAIGRPVLYAGPEDSAVAGWIEELDLGWNLTGATLDAVADRLLRLAEAPTGLAPWNERCHRAYRERFSRAAVIDRLDRDLRDLARAPGPA